MVLITSRFLDGTGRILYEIIETHDADSQIGSLFPQHSHVEVEYGAYEGEGNRIHCLGTVRYYRRWLTGLNEDAFGSFLGWNCERCNENHRRFTSYRSRDERMVFPMDVCLSDEREDHFPDRVTASQIHSVVRALAEEGRTEETLVYASPCRAGCGPHWYVMYRRIIDRDSNVIVEECTHDNINHALLRAGFNAPHPAPDQEPADGADGASQGETDTDISQASDGDSGAQGGEIDNLGQGSHGVTEMGQGSGGYGAAEAEGQGLIPWGTMFSAMGVTVLVMIGVGVLMRIRRNNQ